MIQFFWRRVLVGLMCFCLMPAPPAMAAAADRKSPPIVEAVKAADLFAVRTLLGQGAPVNAMDNWHRTLLIIAVQQEDRDMVDFLLARGADCNAANKNGITALIAAAQRDPHPREGRPLGECVVLTLEDVPIAAEAIVADVLEVCDKDVPVSAHSAGDEKVSLFLKRLEGLRVLHAKLPKTQKTRQLSFFERPAGVLMYSLPDAADNPHDIPGQRQSGMAYPPYLLNLGVELPPSDLHLHPYPCRIVGAYVLGSVLLAERISPCLQALVICHKPKQAFPIL